MNEWMNELLVGWLDRPIQQMKKSIQTNEWTNNNENI